MSNFDPTWPASQRLEVIGKLAEIMLKSPEVSSATANTFMLAISSISKDSPEALERIRQIIQQLLSVETEQAND